MRRYVWKKKDSYSSPVGLTKLMAVAGVAVVAGRGPFSLSQDGDQIAGKLARSEVLSRFRKAISARELGSTFRIRKGNGTVVFTARAVRVEDPTRVKQTNSTNGNDRSDIYYNWVKAVFHQYSPRYAGSYVCKNVSGSSTLSQHSYGNAVDFFFDSLAHQDAVADAVVKNADVLHPYHVISKDRIWTKGQGWHGYGGDFHAHLHTDFDPQYSGGCGVRG